LSVLNFCPSKSDLVIELFLQSLFLPKASQAYNNHTTMRGRPPTMGRTVFGQWVRIFKAFVAAKAMDSLAAICEHYIGRALTKVGCLRPFFLIQSKQNFH
jgi:hypothetical protein